MCSRHPQKLGIFEAMLLYVAHKVPSMGVQKAT